MNELLAKNTAPNHLLATQNYFGTQNLIVQRDRNRLILRRRELLDEAGCPLVVATFENGPDGGSVLTTKCMRSGAGGLCLALTTFYPAYLAVVLMMLPHNILALRLFPFVAIMVVGVALLIPLTHHIRALAWMRRTQTDADSFFANSFGPTVAQLSAGQTPSLKTVGSAIVSTLTTGPDQVSTPLIDLKQPPIEGVNIRFSTKLRTTEILRTFEHHQQNKVISLPTFLGFSNTAHFASAINGEIIKIKRVRLTNSPLFIWLTHLIDLDMALHLKAKLESSESGHGSTLDITVSTTLARKLWTILVVTIAFPAACIAVTLLGIGLMCHDWGLIAGFLAIAPLLAGCAWTMFDLAVSDRAEYVLLIEELGKGFRSELGHEVDLKQVKVKALGKAQDQITL